MNKTELTVLVEVVLLQEALRILQRVIPSDPLHRRAINRALKTCLRVLRALERTHAGHLDETLVGEEAQACT